MGNKEKKSKERKIAEKQGENVKREKQAETGEKSGLQGQKGIYGRKTEVNARKRSKTAER